MSILTRRQRWRRAAPQLNGSSTPPIEYMSSCGFLPVRSVVSEPEVHEMVTDAMTRTWKTSWDPQVAEMPASEEQQNPNRTPHHVPKPRIRFDSTVRVILIPTRKEYRAAGLVDLLWWGDRDYSAFKGSAIMELRVILSLHNVEPKVALQRLYQPDNMLTDLDDKGMPHVLTAPALPFHVPKHKQSPSFQHRSPRTITVTDDDDDADDDDEVSGYGAHTDTSRNVSPTTVSPTTVLPISASHMCVSPKRKEARTDGSPPAAGQHAAGSEYVNPYMRSLVTADESIEPAVTPACWEEKSNSLNNKQQCSPLMHVNDHTVTGDKGMDKSMPTPLNMVRDLTIMM